MAYETKLQLKKEIIMRIIATEKAPAAIGPYSQGVAMNGFVFVSGQLPINPETGDITTENAKDMTRQAMKNIEEILTEAGSSLDKIVKTTIYVTDLKLFGEVNQAYSEFFGDNPPARSCVQVSALPKGAGIEIEVIAYM